MNFVIICCTCLHVKIESVDTYNDSKTHTCIYKYINSFIILQNEIIQYLATVYSVKEKLIL